ncbi:cyclic AMP-responsive element-binding protein 5 isoform X2 [Brachyhypopomus gauderio]|uniref:cyclic AMP-responsive element-binding protein 5 isoform X2 n=1 Tax=Brachyhypopomus gauderio TaxID=698409 RepID=UPI0040423CBB
MNVDQTGLYMCSAPGCAQRFQREDHLIIHRHKHEMILKIPSIKCDSTLSDQTPTPTRFLRNCEEVGLFSELELDQTTEEEEEDSKQQPPLVFILSSVMCHKPLLLSNPHITAGWFLRGRPALADNCALQGLLAPSKPHQCQLHQHPPHPQQAPPLPQHAPPLPKQGPPLPQQPPPPSRAPQPRPGPSQLSLAHLHEHALLTESPPCSVDLHSCNTATAQSAPSCLHRQQSFPEACAVQGTCAMHTPKVMPGQTHPVAPTGNQNSMGHMIMDHMMSSQEHRRAGLPLTHLPAPSLHSYQHHCHGQTEQRHTLHHQSQDQPPQSCAHPPPHVHLHHGPSHPTVTHLTHQSAPAQVSPVASSPPHTHSPPQVSAVKRRHTAVEDPDERRRKFLERNRAAASRCRQKRKIWVTSLERKAEELTHTNLQLQNEVTLLRSEVTQLKQILKAHEDCPVTTRQRVSQVGSPGSSSSTHIIQHNSLSASSNRSSTRLPTPSHCTS